MLRIVRWLIRVELWQKCPQVANSWPWSRHSRSSREMRLPNGGIKALFSKWSRAFCFLISPHGRGDGAALCEPREGPSLRGLDIDPFIRTRRACGCTGISELSPVMRCEGRHERAGMVPVVMVELRPDTEGP
jgi:hypothetical protein